MNWRRGLFRLWTVGAVVFAIAVGCVSYSGIKAEFDAVASKPGAAMASSLSQFRQQHPEYTGLNDAQLADAVHKHFYSDMPREEFAKKLAEKIAASKTKIVEFQGHLHQFPANVSDQEIETALKSTMDNPWASVGVAVAIAFGTPLVVLVFGASLVWAFSGFSTQRS
jgi:hypothetical protein